MSEAEHDDDAEIIEELRFDQFSIYKRHDGIIVITIADNAFLTLKDTNQSDVARRNLTRGNPHLLLVIAGKRALIDKEVRNYGANMEMMHDVIAMGVVIRNFPQRLIGNLFLTMDRPPRPVKLFENAAEAITWLKLQEHATP